MPKTHGYKYVEHIADVEFIASGKTLDLLFKYALLALFDTSADLKKISNSKKPRKVIQISDSAHTLEDLLWYVLQDALSAADSEGIFLCTVKGIKITKGKNGEFKAKARVVGVEKEQAYAKLDAKGVSRYDLKIEKKGAIYKASVVLDV